MNKIVIEGKEYRIGVWYKNKSGKRYRKLLEMSEGFLAEKIENDTIVGYEVNIGVWYEQLNGACWCISPSAWVKWAGQEAEQPDNYRAEPDRQYPRDHRTRWGNERPNYVKRQTAIGAKTKHSIESLQKPEPEPLALPPPMQSPPRSDSPRLPWWRRLLGR
jgi:hypothetical protein